MEALFGITPVIRQGLPTFLLRLMLLTYRVVNGTAPPYIYEIPDFYNPFRSGLRSANKTLLVQPKSSRSWGDRAFSVAAPRIWNSLPNFIRSCSSVCSNPYSRNISSNLLMNWINLYFCMLILLHVICCS